MENLGKKIVIAQRGWVFVGDVTKNGSELTLTNAAVVRRWGTTNGLGELASSGPLENTKLDPSPDITIHELTVIAIISCDAEKWNK